MGATTAPGEPFDAIHARAMPSLDALDKKIGMLAVPAILNLLILPLVGAVDTYWVGRMGDALCLAGMQAANQVFSSTFWVISFLPAVVSPMVAKVAASKDTDALREKVGEAMWLGTLVGMLGTALLLTQARLALSLVLPAGSSAYLHAEPYIKYRAVSFIPSLLSTIAFATFRGRLDTVTPLKISLFTQMLNVILDPVLVFRAGLGVAGAAAATAVAECTSGVIYLQRLIAGGLLDLRALIKPPSFTSIKPLLVGGLAVQLRALALNAAFISVTRTTQALDTTGTLAAAHAITLQLWQLGGVFLFGLSGVASILVPSELGKTSTLESRLRARNVAKRMLSWGVIVGCLLGGLQIAALPLLKTFSPLEEVQQAARVPSIIGASLQTINGLVFVGEGIMQGTGSFLRLALSNGLATLGMLSAMSVLAQPTSFGLNGVWASFSVFNAIRLAAVLLYFFRDGPLAPRNLGTPEDQHHEGGLEPGKGVAGAGAAK